MISASASLPSMGSAASNRKELNERGGPISTTHVISNNGAKEPAHIKHESSMSQNDLGPGETLDGSRNYPQRAVHTDLGMMRPDRQVESAVMPRPHHNSSSSQLIKEEHERRPSQLSHKQTALMKRQSISPKRNLYVKRLNKDTSESSYRRVR